MNKITNFIVEEREELLDTLNNKNDTLRVVYRINTGNIYPGLAKLETACLELIDAEAGVDYKAITFFFWKDGMAVGEEAALASLTYAPGGIWENAMDAVGETEPMKLVVDFNRYTE